MATMALSVMVVDGHNGTVNACKWDGHNGAVRSLLIIDVPMVILTLSALVNSYQWLH
jgi:prepilin-type processing-associated H-X9-DG protein